MSELIMIDSSCWIKYFRNSDIEIADKVESFIKSDRACICGIIELEIVQGIRSIQQSSIIQDVFSVLTYFDFQRPDFIKAGNTISDLRQNGISVALSDSLIAELCKRIELKIFTTDNDFSYFQGLEIIQ
ncbi:MAG: hypothetical protein HW421_1831 [Ignavibacteria bacterium]|nr:hypothetical protein [Ignavibacteria bacterium]